MIKDLILKNRSYRRFYQETEVDRETLKELIDLARLTASGGNKQYLKYIISSSPDKNELIFKHLTWAGYLADWTGPAEGERPSAYIIILGDTAIIQSFGVDHGLVAQSILLGATEKGLGGCIIGAVRRQELSKALNIPIRYEILLVLAIGKPKETIVIDSAGENEDIKYWRDSEGIHHVPKRSLDNIIID